MLTFKSRFDIRGDYLTKKMGNILYCLIFDTTHTDRKARRISGTNRYRYRNQSRYNFFKPISGRDYYVGLQNATGINYSTINIKLQTIHSFIFTFSINSDNSTLLLTQSC